MKKVFLALAVVTVALVACNNDGEKKTTDAPATQDTAAKTTTPDTTAKTATPDTAAAKTATPDTAAKK